jgi:anti-sigma factor RsiW
MNERPAYTETELVGRLLGPEGPELTCEQCFEHLDRYVDVEASADETAAEAAVPGMRAHLDGCPACEEDHRSLLALVESEGGDEQG